MIVLVCGVTATHRIHADSGYLGHLVTPRGGHRMGPIVDSGQSWGADNDGFSRDVDAADYAGDYLAFLERIESLPRCLFVTCPDKVADARGTLERFDRWQPEVARRGLPAALVGQDGAEEIELPWDRMEALFIGGSTIWKESRAAMDLCDEAKRRHLHVHVGRVNTLRRLKKVFDWGSVDSIDGTCFSRWPDKFFPWFIGHINRLDRQPLLWSVEP